MFPIYNYKYSLPTSNEPGGFGYVRKYDVHCGIDLYCVKNEPVYAIEDGQIKSILPFTGLFADSPWWNDTDCLMIEGKSGVINYGEIKIKSTLYPGKFITEGECIGNVVRVLKKDKGLPMDMLHLELYTHGIEEPVWWHLGKNKPNNLLNPYSLLESFYENRKLIK